MLNKIFQGKRYFKKSEVIFWFTSHIIFFIRIVPPFNISLSNPYPNWNFYSHKKIGRWNNAVQTGKQQKFIKGCWSIATNICFSCGHTLFKNDNQTSKNYLYFWAMFCNLLTKVSTFIFLGWKTARKHVAMQKSLKYKPFTMIKKLLSPIEFQVVESSILKIVKRRKY